MKVNRFILVALLLFLVVGKNLAQTPNEAAAYFEGEQYELALESYANLLKKKPKESLYNYRYAYSAYMLGENKLAAEFFEKAADKYPMAYYFMGNIYFNTYRFDEATDAFTDFLDEAASGDSLVLEVEKNLDRAILGSRLIKRVEDVDIVDSVVVDKQSFLNYFQQAKDLGSLKELIGENKDNISGAEYVTERGDRKYNAKLHNGKFQLFTSQKLLENWDVEQVVEELNTMGDVNFPFLQADGVTFYFGANGDESLGGYDIFITRLNLSTNKFLTPENLGMPFNSLYNDYMLVLDEINQVGWFVSDRFLPNNKVAIYQFIPNREKVIVKSENPNEIIARATLESFMADKEKSFTFINNGNSSVGSKQKQIFINNQLIYTDDNSFVSQTAKNYYFQAEKLVDELQLVDKELKSLRQNYSNSPNDRSALSTSILNLENKKTLLHAQIDKLQHEMRQEENKILAN